MPVANQSATYPVNAQFVEGNDRFTLVGLSVDRSPHEVTLYLHWRADTFITGPYVFSMISVAPDKVTELNQTWEPLGWKTPSPPSCWLPGTEYVDTVVVPLGDNVKPGDWTFSLSASGVYTRSPMKVITTDGQTITQVGIGPVNVPAN